jgi:hypothetical protein
MRFAYSPYRVHLVSEPSLIASQAGQSDRVDAIERRLARVERRLDLVDEH